MPRTNTILATVVAIGAEAKGIDFGLGKGVLAKVELLVPCDPAQAAIALFQVEPDLIRQVIRIDYTDPSLLINMEGLCV